MTNGRNNSNRKRNPPTPSLEQKGNKTIKDKVLRVPQKSNKSVTQNRNQNRGKTGRAAAHQYVPQSLEAQGYVSDLERRARVTEHFADKNDWPPVGPNERNLTFDSKSSYNTGTGLKEVYTIIPLLTDRRAVVVGIKDDGSVHYLSTLATNKHIADCASTHTPIAAMVKLWCQGSPDNSSQLGNVESHIIAGHVDADSLLDGFDDNEIFQKQYNKRFNLGADTHTADLAMCLPVLALMDLTHSIPCTTRSAQQNPGITLIRQFGKFRRDSLGLPTDEISDHLLRNSAGWVKMHEIQIPVNYSGKIKVNVSGSFRSQDTVSTTNSDPSPPSVALYVTDTTGAEYGIGSQGIGSISSGTPKVGDVVAYGGSTFFNFEIDQLSDVMGALVDNGTRVFASVIIKASNAAIVTTEVITFNTEVTLRDYLPGVDDRVLLLKHTGFGDDVTVELEADHVSSFLHTVDNVYGKKTSNDDWLEISEQKMVQNMLLCNPRLVEDMYKEFSLVGHAGFFKWLKKGARSIAKVAAPIVQPLIADAVGELVPGGEDIVNYLMPSSSAYGYTPPGTSSAYGYHPGMSSAYGYSPYVNTPRLGSRIA